MQKILLITDDQDRSYSICKIIEKSFPYQVHIAQNFESVVSQLESRVFNLCIIDMAQMDLSTLKLTAPLQLAGNTFPQIFLTKKADTKFMNKIKGRNDIHLLFQPINEKNLLGIVRKLLLSKKVPRQQFIRYHTNQIAQIETLSNGDNLLTSMYNLSKGGAYCEFESTNTLVIGDIIRFKIALPDSSKEYTFNAKVVWTTLRGRFSGRFGCGFRFVNSNETYGTHRV